MITEKNRLEANILKDEYVAILNIIDSFDSKPLTIKTWSVTTTLSAFAAAFVSKIEEVLLLAAAAALIFWLLEYYWKTFQCAYFERLEEIEAYMRGEIKELQVLQASNR